MARIFCAACDADLDHEPNYGWVDALSGDEGGTYDFCPAAHRYAHQAVVLQPCEGCGRPCHFPADSGPGSNGFCRICLPAAGDGEPIPHDDSKDA